MASKIQPPAAEPAYKLTAKERKDLDHLSRKAGVEVALAAGELESPEAEERFLEGWGVSPKDHENHFPSRSGLKLPEGGGWIMVKDPPPCEITVPPFSIWFATPWYMKPDNIGAVPHRVKVVTPAGSLGVMPCEYTKVAKITDYLGRESEGILMHQMNGSPVVNTDQLFYLMSRGIPKKTALVLLLEQIKDPTFLWFEIAPPYGRYFGREWPDPKRCPFCTPIDQWKEEPALAASK